MVDVNLILEFLAYQVLFIGFGLLGAWLMTYWLGRSLAAQAIAHGAAACAVLAIGVGLLAFYDGVGPFSEFRPVQLPLDVHPESYGIEYWGLGVAACLHVICIHVLRRGLITLGLREMRLLSATKFTLCVFAIVLVFQGYEMIHDGTNLALILPGASGSGATFVEDGAAAEAFWNRLPVLTGFWTVGLMIAATAGLGRGEEAALMFFGRA